MRIHASGVGATFQEAMVKAREELQTAALHASELEAKEVLPGSGVKVINPAEARVDNKHAAELESCLQVAQQFVKPKEGHLFRVMVTASDDGADNHCRIEVDMIRS